MTQETTISAQSDLEFSFTSLIADISIPCLLPWRKRPWQWTIPHERRSLALQTCVSCVAEFVFSRIAIKQRSIPCNTKHISKRHVSIILTRFHNGLPVRKQRKHMQQSQENGDIQNKSNSVGMRRLPDIGVTTVSRNTHGTKVRNHVYSH